MMNFILLVLLLSSNSLFAESRRVFPITTFLKKENYLTDFKNNFEKLGDICFGKVVVEDKGFSYFVCNKTISREGSSSTSKLEYILKEKGLKRPDQPFGSFFIRESQSYFENKIQNGKKYFVFRDDRRYFFIEIEKAKGYIDFLANKKFPDVHPNPAHQVCFKKSECISVNLPCTEQVGINKKYLKKYTESLKDRNLEECKMNEKEIEIKKSLSCSENICTINKK